MSQLPGGPTGFVIEDAPEGPTLVLTGPWTVAADAPLRTGQVDGLVVNYARGFCEGDLEFLMSDWPLRRLEVLDRGLLDLEPISRLADSLEELSVQAAPRARLDLATLPRLQSVAGEWALLRPTLDQVPALRSLITWRFDESNLLALTDHTRLERLTIKEARRLQTLHGITCLESLSFLSLGLARQLTDLGDIGDLSSSLRGVDLEDCTRLGALDGLAGLIHLRLLGFSDCSDIESLGPIRDMSKLETVWAWGTTRIRDGDLSPLLALPRLRELRMRGRREYRPPIEEVESKLPRVQ
jgi:hypothetical protein